MAEQKVKTKKIKGGPDLTLSANDKMYLAIAFNQSDRLAFIHTLFCRMMDSGSYNGRAEIDVLTFKKTTDAMVYYAALQEIMRYQSSAKAHEWLSEFNKELIAQFYAAKNQK